MRLLIVDDEVPARARLRRLIEALGGHDVAGEAANGLEALEQVHALEPDVVLLDVRMPGMDGLEAARHLARLDLPPAVVFTTAYDEHALEAFDVNAIAYLLKPVRADTLGDVLQRAQRPTRAQLGALGDATPRSHVSAQVGGALRLVHIDDIACFVAEQKYVCARHTDGELLLDEPLKALETEFGPRFVRIHRNALVAPAFIEALVPKPGGGARVVLRANLDELEVSRRHLAAVRRTLKGRR